ncbi:hypothetical protein BCR43DRAFT_497726 [Syncephalastrum racemosum]|uniref:Uncharacterized protein n=1 Tax=Syncephalastrum racemosum TaxID=13706 RepID=A0A1X2H2T9_SYNRA|nr:hypothetical protein BCR43DRAFT_497726 [Syncephalastrum racemosum]
MGPKKGPCARPRPLIFLPHDLAIFLLKLHGISCGTWKKRGGEREGRWTGLDGCVCVCICVCVRVLRLCGCMFCNFFFSPVLGTARLARIRVTRVAISDRSCSFLTQSTDTTASIGSLVLTLFDRSALLIVFSFVEVEPSCETGEARADGMITIGK